MKRNENKNRIRKVTVVPMTPSVIEQVERLAKADGMNGLVIHNKDGTRFYDSSWIAGVNYTEGEIYDDIYHDSDYENESQNDDEFNEAEYEIESESESENEETDEDSHNNATDTDQESEDDSVPWDNDIPIQEESSDENNEDENGDPSTEEDEEAPLRRSSRGTHVSERLKEYREQTGKTYTQAALRANDKTVDAIFYQNMEEARVIASIILYQRDTPYVVEHTHATTYSLKAGIRKFGSQGKKAARDEMGQLHERKCWHPVHRRNLTPIEKSRALEMIFFITQKSNGTLKGRSCANGSVQRKWMDREEVSSPTVSTEATLITGVIEAREKRDVATCDIPNAFVQTKLPEHDKHGHKTIMKIRGPLLEILCEMDPTYEEYVVTENNKRVLYVHLTRALYGMLASAMLFYNKLKKDLIEYGFTINPYDPCVANKIVEGTQITVLWHVDDIKVSHKKPSVVDEFLNWVKDTYGKIGKVKITRGATHEYLGMKLHYTKTGTFIVDMQSYVQTMVEQFPNQDLPVGKKTVSPWTDDLFKVNSSSPKLAKAKAEQFHTSVAQGLFLCKRARPDINPVIAFLTTRVKAPTEEDWKKLVRLMLFLRSTQTDCLILSAPENAKVMWYVDASFALHPDMRSHSGYVFTFGKGAIASSSRKQSLNTRSSTEAELVAADDAAGPMLWTQRFLQAQGFGLTTIMYQDNKSAMLLEQNGRSSAGKRSRHLDIRYYFIHDLINKGYVHVEHCATEKMIADYMTKPLHGSKFNYFRRMILGQD